MLVIREAQIGVLRQAALAAIEHRLVEHFLRSYPRECRLAGGRPAVVTLVRAGMAAAEGHGLASEQQAARYIGLMIMLGSAFDQDPQLPWAAALLGDTGFAPAARIATVYDRALEYLGEIAGEDGELIVRAMLRIRGFDLAGVPRAPADQEGELCALLGGLYPQKLAAQGERPTRALIRQAVARAAEHRLVGDAGIAVFVTLAFMLGSGFDQDPLYPWAARALADTTVTDEPARVALLHREAMAYLNDSLSR